MARRPGGEISARPLHFAWIADCSASMGLDGKIEALNRAIRDALPSMRAVSDANPNASVFLRTLRFSSHARWVERAPTPLLGYQWTELVADDLPQTPQFSAEFRSRLQREGAQTGDVQFSLAWDNYNDLDLHVFCPSGERIYFGHRRSACGGELDVDMNVSPTSTSPVENVFWPPGGAPAGTYRVLVHHYNNHGRPGCADPSRYRVATKLMGEVREYTGSVSTDTDPQLVCEVIFDPRMAAASGGGNTCLGAALRELAAQLKIPPMPQRALPPVLVLISDGNPTDDFEAGLARLMAEPWGKKAVRVAIAIGQDVDLSVLDRFVANPSLPTLQANNPEALVQYIQWASTAVLQSSSAPSSRSDGDVVSRNVVAAPVPAPEPISVLDVW